MLLADAQAEVILRLSPLSRAMLAHTNRAYLRQLASSRRHIQTLLLLCVEGGGEGGGERGEVFIGLFEHLISHWTFPAFFVEQRPFFEALSKTSFLPFLKRAASHGWLHGHVSNEERRKRATYLARWSTFAFYEAYVIVHPADDNLAFQKEYLRALLSANRLDLVQRLSPQLEEEEAYLMDVADFGYAAVQGALGSGCLEALRLADRLFSPNLDVVPVFRGKLQGCSDLAFYDYFLDRHVYDDFALLTLAVLAPRPEPLRYLLRPTTDLALDDALANYALRLPPSFPSECAGEFIELLINNTAHHADLFLLAADSSNFALLEALRPFVPLHVEVADAIPLASYHWLKERGYQVSASQLIGWALEHRNEEAFQLAQADGLSIEELESAALNLRRFSAKHVEFLIRMGFKGEKLVDDQVKRSNHEALRRFLSRGLQPSPDALHLLFSNPCSHFLCYLSSSSAHSSSFSRSFSSNPPCYNFLPLLPPVARTSSTLTPLAGDGTRAALDRTFQQLINTPFVHVEWNTETPLPPVRSEKHRVLLQRLGFTFDDAEVERI